MKISEKEFVVEGPMLHVGDPAPDFKLTANDWTSRTLADYAGKVKILSIVPSLDTRVCSAQTRRFNEEAANFGDGVVVLTVSADLPYAQKRWCGAEGIERVVTLSDHLDMNFSMAYGVNVVDRRICQRACFVVDQNNVIQHAEYVPVMGNEIDFIGALSTVQKLV
jgi:thiol peroxidase